MVIAAATYSGVRPGWGRWNDTDVYRTRELRPLQTLALLRSGRRSVQRVPAAETRIVDRRPSPLARIKSALSTAFKTPDEHVGWVPFAVAAGLRAARKRRPHAILVSAPPHSSHLAGVILSKLLRRPLIVDFRDPWTMNEDADKYWSTDWVRRWNDRLERFVLRRARYVIVNTRTAQQMFLERYPWLRTRLTTITNGFDPAVLDNLIPCKFDKFTLTHAGSFYAERNPDCFLKGLARWLNPAKDPMRRRSTQVLFIGRSDASVLQTITRLRLEDIVTLVPPMPPSELYPILVGSSALLLMLGFRECSRYVIPAKLYDYLAVGQPIMAFVPEQGEVSTLLSNRGLHCVVTRDDPDTVARALDSLYMSWQRCELQGESSEIERWPQFWRPTLARRLAEVLAQVVDGAPTAPARPPN